MANTGSIDETMTHARHAKAYDAQRPGSEATSDQTAVPLLREGLVLKGRYLLERKIGTGGMGEVFQARNLEEERISRQHGGTVTPDRLAIKILQPEMSEFVLEELHKTRQLVHQNIVRAGDCQQDGPLVFMTMELLEGSPLDKLLDRDFAQGVPWDLARTIIEELGDGLSYAHDRGFVHCDLKPSNIFVTRAFRPKILDFGIARAVRSGTKSNLPAALTPRYASPEMLRAWYTDGMRSYRPDRRDDIFALGCIVYELLTGSHPFGDELRDADEAAREGWSVPEINGLAAHQHKALAGVLALDRAARTSKVELFVQAFLQPPPPRLLPLWRILAGLGATLAAVIVGIVLWRSKTDTAPLTASPSNPPAQLSLITKLGIEAGTVPATPAALRELVEMAPRRVKLGSTADEILDALTDCRRAGDDCSPDRYADERERQALLRPYALDVVPVSVMAFKAFADTTGYMTEVERDSTSPAYHYTPTGLIAQEGETWRRSAAGKPTQGLEPVVAVTFEDAQAYCHWKDARLPTEDEWEYAARGPDRTLYATGANPPSVPTSARTVPNIGTGPTEGVGGRFRNLSRTVWQWTTTDRAALSATPREPAAKVLKGGSWLEYNPADSRAAVRRVSPPHVADDVTGFRCARDASVWPDAELWLRR